MASKGESEFDRQKRERETFEKLRGHLVPPSSTGDGLASASGDGGDLSPFDARHAHGQPVDCDPQVHAVYVKHLGMLRKGINPPPLTLTGGEPVQFVTAVVNDLVAQGWERSAGSVTSGERVLDLDGVYEDAKAEMEWHREREGH